VTASFLPSINGLHFDNAFPDGPAVTFKFGPVQLGVGNAADGLCGGMVFAALDYWNEGQVPPPDTVPPVPGTPMFRYVLRRLIDSWHLPAGPLAYYARMTSWLPERLAVTRQWPAIKSDLDAGWPCPLGLVRIKSANPLLLGRNHQVLAFNYLTAGSGLQVNVYDPNQADVDDVVLRVDLNEPTDAVLVGRDGASEVLSFFRVQYHPKVPPFGHDASGDVVRRRA
jgi:hypothetical protein